MKEKQHVNKKQNKEFVCYFPLSGYFLESRASICIRVTLEDKCPNHKWPPLLPPFPELLLLSMLSCDTEFLFIYFGSAVLGVFSPDLLVTPWPPCWVKEYEKSFDIVQE